VLPAYTGGDPCEGHTDDARSGFDVPVDDETKAKFTEMRYLEQSIGTTASCHPTDAAHDRCGSSTCWENEPASNRKRVSGAVLRPRPEPGSVDMITPQQKELDISGRSQTFDARDRLPAADRPGPRVISRDSTPDRRIDRTGDRRLEVLGTKRCAAYPDGADLRADHFFQFALSDLADQRHGAHRAGNCVRHEP
jgi:hypothetical protein